MIQPDQFTNSATLTSSEDNSTESILCLIDSLSACAKEIQDLNAEGEQNQQEAIKLMCSSYSSTYQEYCDAILKAKYVKIKEQTKYPHNSYSNKYTEPKYLSNKQEYNSTFFSRRRKGNFIKEKK